VMQKYRFKLLCKRLVRCSRVPGSECVATLIAVQRSVSRGISSLASVRRCCW
jgi:hypothetical protein